MIISYEFWSCITTSLNHGNPTPVYVDLVFGRDQWQCDLVKFSCILVISLGDKSWNQQDKSHGNALWGDKQTIPPTMWTALLTPA